MRKPVLTGFATHDWRAGHRAGHDRRRRCAQQPVLLVARVVQGLGGGVLIVALYVVIGRVFQEEHRPAAFAAMSSAWRSPR
ncbi:hypothetical protein [Saccharopolyspora hattusasensis]|uniref:hypothetical protein n=1 Tax=Saccharopolyspora hattusasensis TaxID=1128679 RepID=UPI003D95CFCD